jgi:hypothetical protein
MNGMLMMKNCQSFPANKRDQDEIGGSCNGVNLGPLVHAGERASKTEIMHRYLSHSRSSQLLNRALPLF